MDEQSLAIFASLAETQNTRDTAALLRVNQSNVSRALARIEAAVGASLFERNGRRLMLNARGQAFLPEAEAVIRAFGHARNRAEALRSQSETLRIGFVRSVGGWMLPSAIREFRRTQASVRIDVRQGYSRDVLVWLEREEIDVGFCTAPATRGPRIMWEELEVEELQLAVPTGHRLSERSEIHPDDLRGTAFISFSSATELRGITAHLLPEDGLLIAFEGSDVEVMRSLVAAGLGVSILPVPKTPKNDAVEYVSLSRPTQRRLGVAWCTGADLSPTVGALLAAAKRSASPAEARSGG